MRRIYKIPKTNDKHYATILNETIRNNKLSWSARGLLVYILSLPETWEINIEDLIQRGDLKRYGLNKVIDELVEYGYIRKVVKRDINGRVCKVTYIIGELPLDYWDIK
jgi:DNA-binding MarR family transcriptional regulator